MTYYNKRLFDKLPILLTWWLALAIEKSGCFTYRPHVENKQDAQLLPIGSTEDSLARFAKIHERSLSHSRRLTQREDQEQHADTTKTSETCDKTEIQQIYYDRNARRWILNDSQLTQTPDIIQAVINCSLEDDVILLRTNQTLKLTNTLIIPWSLRLSADPEEISKQNTEINGTNSRVNFTCPNQGTLLSIRGSNVTISNINFVNCATSDDILSLEATCENKKAFNEVRLQHVSFQNNTMFKNKSIIATAAPSCTRLTLHTVRLVSNHCSRDGCASMASVNKLINVNVERNYMDGNSFNSYAVFNSCAVFTSPASANTTATSILGSSNQIRIFRIANYSTFKMSDSLFEGNRIDSSSPNVHNSVGGSVIYSEQSNVTIINSTFKKNTGYNGGTVNVLRSKLTLRNCTFQSNNAFNTSGGAFHAIRGNVVIKATEFNENKARYGGACFVKKSTIKLRNVNFSKNVAVGGNGLGGAIYHEAAAINGRTLTFLENQATTSGGALYTLYSKNIFLADVDFQNNSARNGGAILTYQAGLVLLSQCVFDQNHASNEGGGIWMSDSHASISSCHFNSSNASRGGALRAESHSNVSISGARFLNGTAYNNGGAIDLVQSSTMNVLNALFSGNNAGDQGGGINVIDNSTLSISNTTLERNNAKERGGGIHVDKSTLTISNCSLTRNQVEGNGGGIFGTQGSLEIEHAVLDGNEANSGGGMHLDSMDIKHLNFSSFANNSAHSDGGSILMKNSNASISFCEFNSTRAERGGALRVEFQSVVNITGCNFSNGNATIDGGAIDLVQSSTMNISSALFSGNHARKQGGFINVNDNSTLLISYTTLERNNAKEGGGMSVNSSALTISNCNLTQNQARDNGGGIFGTLGSLEIEHAVFDGNEANSGGGMHFDSMDTKHLDFVSFVNNSADSDGGAVWITNAITKVLISNCKFTRNKAGGSGAGLHLSQSNVIIQQTEFLLNEAKSYTGIYGLQKSNLVCTQTSLIFNTAVESGGGIGIDPGSSLRCFECEFKNNSARRGAGLYIDSNDSKPIVAQLQDSTFENNNASEYGGGIYFTRLVNVAVNCSWPNIKCSRLVLLNTNFTRNFGNISGSVLTTVYPEQVHVLCNYSQKEGDFINQTLLKSMDIVDPYKLCPTWKHNQVLNESRGGAIATSGIRLHFHIDSMDEAEIIEDNDRGYVIYNRRKRKQLPPINVMVLDQYGRGPAPTRQSKIELEVSSDDGYFKGKVVTTLTNGIGIFFNIVGFGLPKNYTLQIKPNTAEIATEIISIQLFKCKINEESTSDQDLCQDCDALSYKFNPVNGSCTPCPRGASCAKRYIVPKKGYWHKSPCHHRVMKCLKNNACQDQERQKKLEAFTEESSDCEMSDTTRESYSNILCSKGYDGPLCGSCQEGYGLSLEFECSECPHTIWSVLTILSLALYLLVLASFTIRGGLPVNFKPRNQSQSFSPEPNLVWSVSRKAAINLQMVEMMRDGYIPLEVRDPSHKIAVSNSFNSVTTDLELKNELEITKWIATEILKILINFLQVTAIAASINVQWREEIIDMFAAEEYIGALTTAAISQPIDCILGTSCSTARSVWRTVLILFVPITAILCFVSFWGCLTLYKKENMSYFWKRSILSIMAVTYISYLGLTKLAVRTFYCVSVYDSEDYLSNSTTPYWAVDTSIKCYGKNHIGLVTIGALVLVFVSLSFPLASAGVIIKNKSRTSDREGWMFETMGFLYRTFKENLMFWETVVMFRKACLSIIVVFPYPLGGQTQGLLAQIVLTLSLCGHMKYLPYKEGFHKLNLPIFQ
eukprot:g6362.t1